MELIKDPFSTTCNFPCAGSDAGLERVVILGWQWFAIDVTEAIEEESLLKCAGASGTFFWPKDSPRVLEFKTHK